jgi:hypothetical protein
VPDCLSERGATIADCSRSLDDAVVADPPNVLATRAMDGRVPLVDMNDLLCADGTCSPVVGNVLVYRDLHHLTGTYVRTLTPYLERRLVATGTLGARGD